MRGTTVAVGSLTSCVSSVSGYEGVFDLSGNVQEWEDSCSTQSGECYARGGSWASLDEYCAYDVECRNNRRYSRDSTSQYRGFRCCSL